MRQISNVNLNSGADAGSNHQISMDNDGDV